MVAPDKIADLIRTLAESRHACQVVQDEAAEFEGPLASLVKLELDSCCEALEETFDRVHRIAKRLSELRLEDGDAPAPGA